jgi:hypothetical protein
MVLSDPAGNSVIPIPYQNIKGEHTYGEICMVLSGPSGNSVIPIPYQNIKGELHRM